MYGVIAIAFRSCLDRGEHAAMEKLEYLKAVFSEEGAEGVGEKLDSTDRDTLRTVTVAAGLSLRAGGKRRSVAELRSAWRSILPVRRARMMKSRRETCVIRFVVLCLQNAYSIRIQYRFLCSKT